MLPMVVAGSLSGILTIGRIACRRGEGDGPTDPTIHCNAIAASRPNAMPLQNGPFVAAGRGVVTRVHSVGEM